MLETREAWKAAGLPHNPAPAAAKRRADPEPGQRSLRWYEPFRSARFRIAQLEDTSGGGATFAIAVPRRPAGGSERA